MLGRRFRSRLLFAIPLLGIFLVLMCLYSPVPFNDGISSVPPSLSVFPSPRGWWKRWWPATIDCDIQTPKPMSETVDTGEVYSGGKLDFRVPDNNGVGFWGEALESRYREAKKRWKDQPLEVIIVPHSHVDPGWLRTYEDYFEGSVIHILDNMVSFLNKTEDFKFIWSEISFFSKWWYRQNQDTQETMKKILRRKQLEIVTGGWVMVDEATTSYFAIIDQLVEGQQWLKHFTNTIPKHGWSVDVFGHSATLPYIISTAGITDMVILRAHYSWKKFLAKMKWFDFYWEQPFNCPRILCHMAPSDLYSFKHTCGPDSFSCLNYDFRRVSGERSESTAEKITDQNVELKANYLLAQYGRYASLFDHNVLLVPLGDDFRFNVPSEWEQQYANYKKLFDYIDGRKDWHARLRFGTVADYFDAVHARLQNSSDPPLISLKGDFLPYGDIYANARPSYWTGYYTTRPFYKKLARELEHWLRASEILYSFSKTIIDSKNNNILLKDYALLIKARQNLAVFQHHDAITGTSRKFVMEDYGQILHTGINSAMTVTSHLTQLLLMKRLYEGNTWTSQVYPDIYRTFWYNPSSKISVLPTENGRKIYNTSISF
ncbi:hypothetical protein JTE90_013978 [Oedothorax gibbosus]|uniref:mannosyl-oligosaccharide 1,3-1,6-alpha-mannosidase n=1 Tax=Oedothorax gibbosus TaxID=931172 RepID=A0AAV6UDW4_9ARAC|nr:hypothetical protein JTE90_013978 [Oedothorax gibbosus]